MHGMDLLEALRNEENTLPFIFFTKNTSPLVRYKAHQMCVLGFIVREGTGKKSIIQLMRLLNWSERDR